MSHLQAKRPQSARKMIKHESFSSFVSQQRLRNVQSLLCLDDAPTIDNRPDALLIVAGIDARYNEGCTELLNYLLFGFLQSSQRQELERSGYEEEIIDDIMIVVRACSVHVYCNPVLYPCLLPYIAAWRGLTLHCLNDKEFEDEEKAEEFKITSLVEMIYNCHNVAVPYSASDRPKEFDKMLIEKWPIIQAFALEDFGGGGFFTLKHEVVDVSADLSKLYQTIDPVALEILITEQLPQFVRQWENFVNNFDTHGVEAMKTMTETTASEPFISYFKHGRAASKTTDKSLSDNPFVLFGSNTRRKNLHRAQEGGSHSSTADISTSGTAGRQAVHLVCDAVSPRSALSCTRTYFLGLPYNPLTGETEDATTSVSDVGLLCELYLACIDAVLAAIEVYAQHRDEQKSENVAFETLLGKVQTSQNKHAKDVLRKRECVEFSLQSLDNNHRRLHGSGGAGSVKCLRVSLVDIGSVEHRGRTLGSVSFSETFLESALLVMQPDGSCELNTDCVILTSNIPRILSWPVLSSDAAMWCHVECGVAEEVWTGLGKLLLSGVECVLTTPDCLQSTNRGKMYVYERGIIYIHKHLGPVILAKENMHQIEFYDGDSPSVVALLILTMKADMKAHLPPHLCSPSQQLALAFLPKTRAYKDFFSEVLSAWREPSQGLPLQIQPDLPKHWNKQHANLQHESRVMQRPGNSPLAQARDTLPTLHSFLTHLSASSCLQGQPVPAKHVASILGGDTDSGGFHNSSKAVVSLVFGAVGSQQVNMCHTLASTTKDQSRWRVLVCGVEVEEVFSIERLAADILTHIKLCMQENPNTDRVRIIAAIPGYTDIVSVVQCIYKNQQLSRLVEVGAVTVCVDPYNVYMCEHRTLPALLDQCAQGWVNNIVFTNGVNPQSSCLSAMQGFVRAVNSDVALLLADKGEVTRTPDVELILNETAWNECAAVRARHLSTPGWWCGSFKTACLQPEFNNITLHLNRPLDKTRLLSKLKGLRALHRGHPFQGNVYAMKGRVAFTDCGKLLDVHYTVLSAHVSITPGTSNTGGGDHNNNSYVCTFTGVGLQEETMKKWLSECTHIRVEKKVLRTRQSLTKTEINQIHSQQHLTTLPEGWYYNGAQYICMDGQKSNKHPLLDTFIDTYLQAINQEVEEHNKLVREEPPLFTN